MAADLHRFVQAALIAVSLSLAAASAQAQSAQSHPWLDSALLAAAKAEGTLTVYSSTNEQEGLPLFKIFEQATGIKFDYIRGNDASLLSRVAIETRAGQPSFDIIHISNAHKMPPQMLAQVDLTEAKNLFPQARDPNRRWYGVYTVYNAPAYNTEKIKASDLPKSFEEFAQHREWAGRIALDGTDIEWLKSILQFHGEQKGTALIKEIVANLKPVLTDGRLAMARSVAAGEYLFSLNNFVNLTLNVKLAGGPIDISRSTRWRYSMRKWPSTPRRRTRTRRGWRRTSCSARSARFSTPNSAAADARRRPDQPARHRRVGDAEEGGGDPVRSAGGNPVAAGFQYPVSAALNVEMTQATAAMCPQ
jgi:iron(III) transport system substrate-binding protein